MILIFGRGIIIAKMGEAVYMRDKGIKI